jgi:hypothetical protein
MMDNEGAQDLVPVRPKTTHVRMGRQNFGQNKEDEVAAAGEEKVQRPKTTQESIS